MPIHSGSETQAQDTRMVATKGVAGTPAYRGTALHVVEDFELADYGNRIPNMQYEVFSSGATQSFRKVITLDDAIFSNATTGGAHYSNGVIYGSSLNSGVIDSYRVLGDGTQVDFQSITPQAPSGSAGDGLAVTDGTVAYNNGRYAYCVFASSPQYAAFFKNGTVLAGGILGADNLTPVVTNNQNFAVGDNYLYLIYDVSTGTRQGAYLTAYAKDGSTAWNYYLNDLGFSSAALSVVRFDATTKALYAVNYDTIAGTMDVYSFDADSETQLLTWTGLINNGQPGGDIQDSIFWYGDFDESTSPGYNRTYLIELNADQTTTTLQSHDGQSAIDGGTDSDTGGTQARWLSSSLVVNGSDLWTYSQPDASDTTLQSVVEDLCARAGMAATDYDASALEGVNIDGYATKGVSSLRQQLEPLMQVYEFEPYEDDFKLKFAFRGGSSILVVTEADMRPHEYGADGGEFIQIQHIEASKLPRRVNVNYMNINADYEPDMQFFERSAAESEHVSDVTFQMAFTPTFAIQLADKLLHEAWVSRTSYTFSLPKKFAYLAPTNVIVLSTADYIVEVRLLEVGTGIDGRIQCRAVQSKILTVEPPLYDCASLRNALNTTYGASVVTICEMEEHNGAIITATNGTDLQNWSGGAGDSNWGHPDDANQIAQCGISTHFRSRSTQNSYPALPQNSPTVLPQDSFNIGMVTRVYASAGYLNGILFEMRIHPSSYTRLHCKFDAGTLDINSVQFESRQFPPTGSSGFTTEFSAWLPVGISSLTSHLLQFRGSIPGTVSLYVDCEVVASHTYTRRWRPDYADASGIGLAWHNGQNNSTSPLADNRNNYDLQMVYAVIGSSESFNACDYFLRNFRGYLPPSNRYISQASTEEPIVGQAVTPIPDTHVFFKVIDTNLLLASDSGLPVYVAGTSANFNGYLMQKSLDDGATWSDIGIFQENEATMGVAQNALGAPHDHFTGRFDPADSLTVKFLTVAPSLSSVTDLQAMGGANAFAVGSEGRWEIISAATITQVDAQTFTLTRLLRGMRGTEAHIGSMQLYDSVVLLEISTIGILPFQSDDIGTTVKLRAIYDTGYPDSDDDVTLTITGNPYKEYAPAQIMAYWRGSGDIELSWNRRARKNGAWRDSVDVPLDALSSPESYTIKIYDNTTSPETLVRTVAGNSTNAYTYSAANIASDFGSPVPAPGQIRVEIYQVDTIVGASRYGEKTL